MVEAKIEPKRVGRPRSKNDRICPSCNSGDVTKLGFMLTKRYGYVQRYKCVTCGRTFI